MKILARQLRTLVLSAVLAVVGAVLLSGCGGDGGNPSGGGNNNGGKGSVVDPKTVVKGTFIDDRDGKTYKTVKIGSQTWMAENLNYLTDSSWCYDDADSNCAKYGRLYAWNAAMTACPAGWKLPDTVEWGRLFVSANKNGYLELCDFEWGYHMAYDFKFYIADKLDRVDSYGFTALPGGVRSGFADIYTSKDNYRGIGSTGNYWTATEGVECFVTCYEEAVHLQLSIVKAWIPSVKSTGASVRCLHK